MPVLRRTQPDGYEPARPGRWRAAVVALIALLAAGVIGWSIGQGGRSTRTVTSTVTVAEPPPTSYQHTAQGAVAAAQAFLYQRAVTPEKGAFAVTNPRAGQLSGVWHLLYYVTSYSSQAATIRTWALDLSYGYGSSSLTWVFTDVNVQWNGSEWVPTANPLTIVPDGATPPPNNTTGTADAAFGWLLYPFRRFAGEP
jgi:hypothetical protein